MNRCLYVNSEEKLSTTQNSLHCADSCLTDFKYPDDPFFKEEQSRSMFNSFRTALHKLDDKAQTIVFTKALNPELSLREVAKVAGITYEGVRLKLKKIARTYPRVYCRITSKKVLSNQVGWMNKKSVKSDVYQPCLPSLERYFLDTQGVKGDAAAHSFYRLEK